jgi:hypothetical protein
MRCTLTCLVTLAGVIGFTPHAEAEEPTARYGIATDLRTYPQETPQESLASLLKAIEAKRIDYLLAQLADPDWVDRRVQTYGGKFERLVQETGMDKLDPVTVKQLQRFAKEGDWTLDDLRAYVRLKDVTDRQVTFRKVGERWFLVNSFAVRGKS